MARHHHHALQAKRDAEYQRTRNAAELDQLQRKWAREDDAHEAAEDWRTRSTADLQRRVAVVERTLGHDGRRIVDALVGAVADALKRIRQEEREHTAEAIQKAFENRCLLDYKGVWSAGQSYVKGAAVTDKGALWIATGPCGIGQRPGTGASCWRLAVKSGEAKRDPTLA